MNWRNDQIYHLRQNTPLTEEIQDNYFRDVVSELFDLENPDQILFSYLEQNTCLGYGGLVHINWLDRNAEISFIIDTKLEKDYFSFHWINFLSMLKEVAFNDLKLHKIYVYAFDLRPHLYPVLLKAGFEFESRLRDHIFYNNQFKDVVIYSSINS